MRNSTEIGDELRDHIIDLLNSRGYTTKREERLNIKKIDILFSLDDDLTRRNIAVEVKNYSRNLSQDELTQIYAAHHSLVSTRAIDEVWVIVRLDFSPEAKNWARSQPNLQIFGLSEFEERLFGFRRYVKQLIKSLEEHDLSRYYIPPKLPGGQPLFDYILKWIQAEETTPIAILGGYGMGKTSFCRFMTRELGVGYLNNSFSRIPVYVNLSEFSKEQDLEGLLGRTLAARYRLANYHFDEVMELNSRGKLVFVFDGFDEMKYGLKWDEFKFNFSQINRTVRGKSKVLIAGRPNAFLSDKEYSWALRGARAYGDKLLPVPDWPSYDEVFMQPFSDVEIKKFLQLYLESKVLNSGRKLLEKDTSWIKSRIEEFEKLPRQDEVSRPVHLKIFADLAAKRDLILRNYSVFELYDIAADMTFEREMSKLERQRISAGQRREIIEDVAWWLWLKDRGRTLFFNQDEIPSGVVDKITDDEYEREGALREIFSGAFFERKFGERVSFAHRSFLEFFVATRLLSQSEALTIDVVNSMLDAEILDFMRSNTNYRSFLAAILAKLHKYQGDVSLLILKEVKRHLVSTGVNLENAGISPQMSILIRALPLYEAFDSEEIIMTLDGLIHNDVFGRPESNAFVALYLVLDAYSFSLDRGKYSEHLDELTKWMLSGLLRREKVIEDRNAERPNLFSNVFARAARIPRGENGALEDAVEVDFGEMLEILSQNHKPEVTVHSNNVERDRFKHRMSFHVLGLTGPEQEVLRTVLETRREQTEDRNARRVDTTAIKDRQELPRTRARRGGEPTEQMS